MSDSARKRSQGSGEDERIGNVQFRGTRTDAWESSSSAFTGSTNVRKYKRRCYLTALMILAEDISEDTLEALLKLGSAAIEVPGSEDPEEAMRQLKELGWRFRER